VHLDAVRIDDPVLNVSRCAHDLIVARSELSARAGQHHRRDRSG
jgi:hypothetical protein